MSKSIDTYEKMLKNSWRTTWHHKAWWILGALAGLASTGAVFNNVFKVFIRLQPAEKITIDTLENIFPSLSWLTAYGRNLVLLDDLKLQLYIVFSIVIIVILITIVLMSQYLLIGSAVTGAKKSPWQQITKLFGQIQHLHLWRLFAIDAISFILTTLLVSIGALGLTRLLSYSTNSDLLIYIGMNAIILPLAFLINVTAMIMLVHVVKHKDTLGIAFREAVLLFKTHWLTALEYALLIFVINFFASLLMMIALLLVAGLTGLLFQAMLGLGSFILMSFATFLGVLTAGVVFITFAGGLTMFNYCAWVELAERLRRYGHIPTIEHGLHRIAKAFLK